MAKQYKTWYLKDAPKVKQFRSWYLPAKRAEMINAAAGSDDLTIDLGAYDQTVLNLQRIPNDFASGPNHHHYSYIYKNTMVYYYIPNYQPQKTRLVDDDPVIRQPNYSIHKTPAPYLDVSRPSRRREYLEFRKNASPQRYEKSIDDKFAYIGDNDKVVRRREFILCIHGDGENHFGGAESKITDYKSMADEYNLILIAPVFERKYYAQPPGFSYPPDFTPPLKMEELARLDRFYQNHPKPDNYHEPDDYLFNFQYLLNKFNYFRSDRRLNEIYEVFKAFYTDVSGGKFNLAGYSAGGQFISRYMMCYPENLNMVALGGAKSYLFPLATYPYPFGLDCSNMNSFFDKPPKPQGVAQGAPEWWANDLRKMDWNKKLNLLMDLNVFHLVGIDDRENEDHDREDIDDPLDDSRLWQGTNRWERAFNYHFEMCRAEYRLRKDGIRDKSKSFQMVFVPLLGDHYRAHDMFPNWLRMCWYNFPNNLLYEYNNSYRSR